MRWRCCSRLIFQDTLRRHVASPGGRHLEKEDTVVAEKSMENPRTAALCLYAKRKNEATIRLVNTAIDGLLARGQTVNFEAVARAAGVSRGTLYNNEELRARICRLRANDGDRLCDALREKNSRQEKKLRAMREQIRCLEEEKEKLIVQLIDFEMVRRENERLKRALES